MPPKYFLYGCNSERLCIYLLQIGNPLAFWYHFWDIKHIILNWEHLHISHFELETSSLLWEHLSISTSKVFFTKYDISWKLLFPFIRCELCSIWNLFMKVVFLFNDIQWRTQPKYPTVKTGDFLFLDVPSYLIAIFFSNFAVSMTSTYQGYITSVFHHI